MGDQGEDGEVPFPGRDDAANHCTWLRPDGESRR